MFYGKLTLDLIPGPGNPRSSEGDFHRLPDGSILFAYSRFCGENSGDDARCDIYGILSRDEGESWGEPFPIARAEKFGVHNLMSVSAVTLTDGTFAFVFGIKEMDGTITFARACTRDGAEFDVHRIECDFIPAYYVLNNNRVLRLSDGRILLPVAQHRMQNQPDSFANARFDSFGCGMFLVSTDELKTLRALPARMILDETAYSRTGIQEPGVIEKKNGVLWIYARTDRGAQYECFSVDGLRTVTPVRQSPFTSPPSPMKIARNPFTGDLYAVWNPIPNYNGRTLTKQGWGRTPLAIAKSTDDGITWGKLQLLEDDPERGYCYPAVFFLSESEALIAYCRGGAEDGICLSRLGIQKIKLDF